MSYKIVETELQKNSVRWVAEDDDGHRISSVVTRWRDGIKMTDEALEDLAQELMGNSVNVECDSSIVDGELKEYSIAGSFGELQ